MSLIKITPYCSLITIMCRKGNFTKPERLILQFCRLIRSAYNLCYESIEFARRKQLFNIRYYSPFLFIVDVLLAISISVKIRIQTRGRRLRTFKVPIPSVVVGTLNGLRSGFRFFLNIVSKMEKYIGLSFLDKVFNEFMELKTQEGRVFKLFQQNNLAVVEASKIRHKLTLQGK